MEIIRKITKDSGTFLIDSEFRIKTISVKLIKYKNEYWWQRCDKNGSLEIPYRQHNNYLTSKTSRYMFPFYEKDLD